MLVGRDGMVEVSRVGDGRSVRSIDWQTGRKMPVDEVLVERDGMLEVFESSMVGLFEQSIGEPIERCRLMDW